MFSAVYLCQVRWVRKIVLMSHIRSILLHRSESLSWVRKNSLYESNWVNPVSQKWILDNRQISGKLCGIVVMWFYQRMIITSSSTDHHQLGQIIIIMNRSPLLSAWTDHHYHCHGHIIIIIDRSSSSWTDHQHGQINIVDRSSSWTDHLQHGQIIILIILMDLKS